MSAAGSGFATRATLGLAERFCGFRLKLEQGGKKRVQHMFLTFEDCRVLSENRSTPPPGGSPHSGYGLRHPLADATQTSVPPRFAAKKASHLGEARLLVTSRFRQAATSVKCAISYAPGREYNCGRPIRFWPAAPIPAPHCARRQLRPAAPRPVRPTFPPGAKWHGCGG